jgi:hypothetical protein
MATSSIRVQVRVRPHKPTDGLYDPAALQVGGKSVTARSVDKGAEYQYE